MSRQEGDAAPPLCTYPVQYFDDLYKSEKDPWKMRTSWYEQRKYAITVASLPKARYRSGFEPGCAIGELTRLLAFRCDQLLAIDCVQEAIESARKATSGFANVRVERAVLPQYSPNGSFDLIVVSELLYYLCREDLRSLIDTLVQCLVEGGDIVAVHWRERGGDHGYDGFNTHDVLHARSELTHLVGHDDETFVLDVWRRRPGPVS